MQEPPKEKTEIYEMDGKRPQVQSAISTTQDGLQRKKPVDVEVLDLSDDEEEPYVQSKAMQSNSWVTPMLTDYYQLTMVYAYWKGGRHNDRAVFELFFRKNPFQGEYTIFAGLSEVIRFITRFKFTQRSFRLRRLKSSLIIWLT